MRCDDRAGVMTRERKQAVRAIVFSGGGARGAYEAGVLRFVFEELESDLGGAALPEIALGTSVGAIHACYLAATADAGPDRWSRLRDHWLDLDLEKFLRFDPLARWRSRAASDDSSLPARMSGLLNTAAIDALIRGVVPWDGISRNLAQGKLHAAGVIATELSTGRAVVFVEGRGVDPALWAHDRSVVVRSASLGVEHVLASAAIPLLFPAVRVGEGYFADGALRLNTPLAPAIHLGADRLLVISLRSASAGTSDVAAPVGTPRRGVSAVLGRVLGALLLDRLDADLGRMQFMNHVLARGARAFGPDFLERMNGDGERELRHIEPLVIRPSQPLGAIARDVARARRTAGRLPRKVRMFLDLAADSEAGADADLLSLLLFDPEYFEALMELGWSDARAHAAELADFFER